MSEPSTAEQVFSAVREYDPQLSPVSVAFMTTSVLIASAVIGADEDEIAHLLGYDPVFVATIGRRLRTARIWIGQAVHAEWAGEEGGIAFSLDLNVALGTMTSDIDARSGERMYSMTAEGREHAEKLIGRRP